MKIYKAFILIGYSILVYTQKAKKSSAQKSSTNPSSAALGMPDTASSTRSPVGPSMEPSMGSSMGPSIGSSTGSPGSSSQSSLPQSSAQSRNSQKIQKIKQRIAKLKLKMSTAAQTTGESKGNSKLQIKLQKAYAKLEKLGAPGSSIQGGASPSMPISQKGGPEVSPNLNQGSSSEGGGDIPPPSGQGAGQERIITGSKSLSYTDPQDIALNQAQGGPSIQGSSQNSSEVSQTGSTQQGSIPAASQNIKNPSSQKAAKSPQKSK
jgi:hypothetical protein